MYSDITSGQSRLGRGGSNHNKNGNNNQRTKNRGGRGGNHDFNKTKKSSFNGVYVELKGSIFDVGAGQTLLYNNTLTNILTYTGKNYTPCVQKSIEGMREMSYH